MAPTLNSTLIGLSSDDSYDRESSSTKTVEDTEKELNQYSPILARPTRRAPSSPHPTHTRNAIKSTLFTSPVFYAGSNRDLSETTSPPPSNEIPIWICGKPRFVSGITAQTTCNHIIEALIEDELHTMDGKGRDAGLSHNLRDYKLTERWRDVEAPLPGDTFILPLWKAWGTKCATNEVKFKLRVNINASSGPQLDVTSQHQKQTIYSSSTEGQKYGYGKEKHNISEKQKLDRKSDRMTLINQMMRKILKQGESIKQHLSQVTDNQDEVQRIGKLCQNIRRTKQGKRILMEQFIKSTNLMTDLDIDPSLLPGTLSSALTSEDELFYMDHPILTDTEGETETKIIKNTKATKAEMDEDEDDELFLVIENNDDLDSGVHFDLNKRPKSQMTEMQPICSSVELTEVLLETPKRKKRSQRNFKDLLALNKQFSDAAVTVCASKTTCNQQNVEKAKKNTPSLQFNPDFKRTSLQFDTIRREIIVKMNDLKDLLQKEEDLIVNLETKCQRYKRENEAYGRTQGQVQLKVDEIQDNLNKCAKEIVQYELDLYKTKLEIRENYLVLDDLKEMLAEKDPISGFGRSEFNRLVEKKFGLENRNGCPSNETPNRRCNDLPSFITSPFVDNVHEFCDNNSIIV